ncbi:MAG: S8 family serine peptidase, partial [Limnobacter sp.]
GVVFETPDLMGRLLSGYDFVSDVPTANDGNGRDANAADPGNWISNSDAQTSTFSGCSVKNSSWHGTFVAGQIAANTHSDSDVAGADWNVKVLPVRVLGKCGGLLSDVLDAMLWSAGLDVPGVPRNPNSADVINLSLGSPTSCSSFEQTVV